VGDFRFGLLAVFRDGWGEGEGVGRSMVGYIDTGFTTVRVILIRE